MRDRAHEIARDRPSLGLAIVDTSTDIYFGRAGLCIVCMRLGQHQLMLNPAAAALIQRLQYARGARRAAPQKPCTAIERRPRERERAPPAYRRLARQAWLWRDARAVRGDELW